MLISKRENFLVRFCRLLPLEFLIQVTLIPLFFAPFFWPGFKCVRVSDNGESVYFLVSMRVVGPLEVDGWMDGVPSRLIKFTLLVCSLSSK